MNFNLRYEQTKTLFESKLYEFIDGLSYSNDTLISAIKYNVKSGGKRIRPVLMLETAKLLNVNENEVMPFAIAIELIHTYSLIHDDLPAMDNDDYRRGNLTTHKVYGEAVAILTGDALLNLAYEVVFRNLSGIYGINAARLLSRFAGYTGMIGGQATDVLNEKGIEINDKISSEELLNYIHENKTGKLILASALIPSCLSGDKNISILREYGQNLGLLFQVTDDILDFTATFKELGKSIGKDENSNKVTFVTVYGLEKAKQLAVEYYNKTINAVSSLEGCKFLIDLAKFVLERKN